MNQANYQSERSKNIDGETQKISEREYLENRIKVITQKSNKFESEIERIEGLKQGNFEIKSRLEA